MATREEVYKAIDGERDYQERGHGRAKFDLKTYGDFIAAMSVYVSQAQEEWRLGNEQGIMNDIRKATALGVQAMEKLGAPARKQPKEEPAKEAE